jgi:plastocyanin
MRTRIWIAWAFAAALAACRGEEEIPPRGPATPLDLSTVGTITGSVSYRGVPPPPTEMRTSADSACGGRSVAYDVAVNGGRVENVFVYIREGLEGRVFERPTTPVTIDQQGCLYRPHVVGAQSGQEIVFLNSDPTLHNVHTTPRNSRPTNFGLGVKGARRSIRIPRAEVMVEVRCDVHPWMRAYIGVLDHPYFAVTGPEGTFRFEQVPPGEYVLEAWHERFGRRTARVRLGARESVSVDFDYGPETR